MNTKTFLEKTIEKNDIPEDVSIPDLDVQDIRTQTSLDKAFSELYSHMNVELKTEFLKNDEIKKLGTLYTSAKHYGFVALQERIIKHMEMRISLKRKGRKEAVEMFKAERQQQNQLSILEKYGRNKEE